MRKSKKNTRKQRSKLWISRYPQFAPLLISLTNTFYICIVHKSRLKLQIHKYSKLEEFVVK
jgi:hypothetical protein